MTAPDSQVDTKGKKDVTNTPVIAMPGTLAQEVDNGGWNNRWDDSYPVDRYPRATSGNRGRDD